MICGLDYDSGEKFVHYRRLESLQEYLLVAQDKIRIEHYVRQGAQWVLSEISDFNDTLHLAAVDCTIVLQDVYDKVRFVEGGASPSSNPDTGSVD